MVKQIKIENPIQKFSLKVVAGESQLKKMIMQSRVHRPDLEFIGHFDFFNRRRVRILEKG